MVGKMHSLFKNSPWNQGRTVKLPGIFMGHVDLDHPTLRILHWCHGVIVIQRRATSGPPEEGSGFFGEDDFCWRFLHFLPWKKIVIQKFVENEFSRSWVDSVEKTKTLQPSPTYPWQASGYVDKQLAASSELAAKPFSREQGTSAEKNYPSLHETKPVSWKRKLVGWKITFLGGGFKHFLFSPLFGEDSHFD